MIDYFSSVGPVKAVRIVCEKETGKPRGFGFVEYFDVPTAESCVRNLNGAELNGRTMTVVFSRDGASGGGGPRGGRAGFGGEPPRSDPRGGRSGQGGKAVGSDAVVHAARGAGETMGMMFDPTVATSRMVSILSRKNKGDMYQYLEQVQQYCNEAPDHAREFLGQNPMLCQAILVMEILLGLVGNPLDTPANNAGAGATTGASAGATAGAGGAAPRPMVSARSQGQGPGIVRGAINEQQEALLAQVLNLTAEQIELLPAQQKAQVLALKQQMGR